MAGGVSTTGQVNALVGELRGFAEGSNSARASLMRDAADALEGLHRESLRRELHHFETEALLTYAGLDPNGMDSLYKIRADAWDEGFALATRNSPLKPHPMAAQNPYRKAGV